LIFYHKNQHNNLFHMNLSFLTTTYADKILHSIEIYALRMIHAQKKTSSLNSNQVSKLHNIAFLLWIVKNYQIKWTSQPKIRKTLSNYLKTNRIKRNLFITMQIIEEKCMRLNRSKKFAALLQNMLRMQWNQNLHNQTWWNQLKLQKTF
jgi:hypothetical protein